MLPDGGVLSSEILDSPFLFPRNIPRRPKLDREHGGIAIQDPSEGLKARVWTGEIIGDDVVLAAPGVDPTTIITVAGIRRFGFTFDQNMQPFITYELEDGGGAFFYWFDTTIPGFTTTELPAGSYSPLCSLDDKRPLQTGTSDIILAYMRDGALYFRAQRDRYLVEYELETGLGSRTLIQIGMNTRLRFQFHLSNA